MTSLVRQCGSLAGLALGALVLAGCAGLPATLGARAVPADFVAVPPQAGLSLSDAGVLALDGDMRTFLARAVTAADDPTKLRQLTRALIENPSFRIEYDDDTRSAAATFHALQGNCLSFTNVFVALAREVGLEVSYQEVDVPPIWTARDDSFVLSRHVNALVTMGAGPDRVVDFNMAEFRAAYPRRAISDARAAAHYYSNLGVERMQAGEPEAAYAYFQRALAMDRTLVQAWVNLGAWYRRQGDPTRAEASYLEALRLHPHEFVALSNLASLHAREGRAELAHWYERRVTQYRLQNPYYRYERAKIAYLAGDFSSAARQLREALRSAESDPTFYSLLGMSYRELGRSSEARAAFARAVELADDEHLRSALQRKLELLGAPSARL
ncbi:MAG TPA: tetratricopeptide repeat protein [Myxococcota bacterium]|jgi:Flp pilus assembly protein TadD